MGKKRGWGPIPGREMHKSLIIKLILVSPPVVAMLEIY